MQRSPRRTRAHRVEQLLGRVEPVRVDDGDRARVIGALERDDRQPGEEALRDENDQYTEEKRRRDEDMQDRLREIEDQKNERLRAGQEALADLETQHDKERAARITAFQQQITREDQERAIRLSRQQQDWAREDTLRQQNFQQQLGLTSGFYSELNGRTITGMETINGTVSTKFAEISSAVNALLAVPAATNYSTNAYGGSQPAYGGGGNPPLNRDVIVGDRGPELVRFLTPARVYSHSESMRMAGGKSMQVSFGDIIVQGGTTREQARDFRNQVEQVIYDVQKRMN